MKDLKTDVRAHKAASHQVIHDLGHVRIRKAIQDHRSVASANKMADADSKRLKAQGVTHPVAKAKRQVKVEDDNHKDHGLSGSLPGSINLLLHISSLYFLYLDRL